MTEPVEIREMWVPGKGWRVKCEDRISTECAGWFYAGNDINWRHCGPCNDEKARLHRVEEAERIDKTGLTPDDDPITGYKNIFTEAEQWRYHLIGRWV